MELIEEIFMINQLIPQLSNKMKLEKYEEDKLIIIKLVVNWILLILKKLRINYS